MATKNDEKIAQLRKIVEQKKKELGSRPKYVLLTNGLFKGNGSPVNLNIISIEKAVEILSWLLAQASYHDQACKALGIEISYKHDDFTLAEWQSDLKNRVKVLQWDDKNRQLEATKKKLNDLMSEDARTETELNEIMITLK